MDLTSFYTETISRYTAKHTALARKRNFVTAAKIVTFAGVIYGTTFYFSDATLTGSLITLPMVVLFLLLTRLDDRMVKKLDLLQALATCSRTEMAYLSGNWSGLKKGNEYNHPEHPYANDLDIFGDSSLFQAMNRTVTGQGEEWLAQWLLTPCEEQTEILLRQEATRELKDDVDWMHLFRATGTLHDTSSTDRERLSAWEKETSPFGKPWQRISLFAMNICTIGCWGVAFFGLVPYSLALLVSLAQLIILSACLREVNRIHAHLDQFVKAIGNYFFLIRLIEQKPFASERLQSIRTSLFEGHNALTAFAALNKILGGFDQRSNILVEVILNGLYLRDIHQVHRLGKWKKEHAKHIQTWMDAVSETDTLISMANFRINHPDYCTPVIGTTTLLEATEMGHPLLQGKNVKNDFTVRDIHNLFIVTGANMAGKSTFLRTTGVNLVLALSGNVVCATHFECQLMDLFTSMRTTDNLAKGTSYFHAELLRLKDLTLRASQGKTLFIILDEMLKGTNSQDKQNGSFKFLKKMLSLPVSGLVATHDLVLGNLATEEPEHFFAVCFEISHTVNDIHYDYKLHQGVSKTMNASILMQKLGLI
jgi:hypothetical protein